MVFPDDVSLVRADATLVEQAIGNVVANAVVHTPKNTQVTIDTVATPDTISLRVTDDGPGIDAAVFPHIFEKFFSGHSPDRAVADGGEGTGLGLAIAKGIVEAHGGSIMAESPIKEGRGTRIILKFPRVEPRQ